MIKYVILIFLLTACATNRPKLEKSDSDIANDGAYLEHLNYLAENVLRDESHNVFVIDSQSNPFLNQLLNKFIANNEILLSKIKTVKFVFVNDKQSFVFSLPDNYIFLSTSLIVKHLKSEALFASVVIPELIRLSWKLYEKNFQFPSGYFPLEKLISITRLPQNEREKINEWSYIALKRAKYDPAVYLNWIQLQNRNSVDFLKYSNDLLNISKEEQQIKNFITRQGVVKAISQVTESNSSKDFYKLLNIIESKIR